MCELCKEKLHLNIDNFDVSELYRTHVQVRPPLSDRVVTVDPLSPNVTTGSLGLMGGDGGGVCNPVINGKQPLPAVVNCTEVTNHRREYWTVEQYTLLHKSCLKSPPDGYIHSHK